MGTCQRRSVAAALGLGGSRLGEAERIGGSLLSLSDDRGERRRSRSSRAGIGVAALREASPHDGGLTESGGEEGHEAVLLGGPPGVAITAWDLAERAGTIPYEILTGFGLRLRREVVPGEPSGDAAQDAGGGAP